MRLVSWAVAGGISAMAVVPGVGGATAEPARLALAGDWRVGVTVFRGREIAAVADVAPPTMVVVRAQRYASLPVFNDKAGGGWTKGAALQGVRAQECTTRHLLDPDSLEVRSGEEAAAVLYELGKDYAADLEWGTVGRLAAGRIPVGQPVSISYRHGLHRIDAIVLKGDGTVEVRQGAPHAATPLPPEVGPGEERLGNVWLPGRLPKLAPEHLFAVLESVYPEPAKPTPTVAEQLLPKTMAKLRSGERLRILAWGDSVTVGTFVPEPDRNRWQAQFVTRLRERFPGATIELLTEAWGGRSTASYLGEPPGSEHSYGEKVLATRPDLVVSEFVNDAGLAPAAVEERYGRLLADFRGIGAEWIVLTPHYVRPDWMGLTGERDIDRDPRPYVQGLREFAARHRVALADASLRYGRLWRQGIPYSSLMMNAINHPDPRGMKLFADSLMALFP